MTPYFGIFSKILEKCQITAADPGRPPPFPRMLDLRIGCSKWLSAKCVGCAESTYIDIMGYRDSGSQWVELKVVGNLPAKPSKVKVLLGVFNKKVKCENASRRKNELSQKEKT
jgi:hypothetical protein